LRLTLLFAKHSVPVTITSWEIGVCDNARTDTIDWYKIYI